MASYRRSLTLLFLLSLFSWARASSILISQVLKGRVFGSRTAQDVSRRVVVGDDGSLYIAGVTEPGEPGGVPWGDVEAGELVGERDVFLAKLSAFGRLVWVKRTGSSKDDELNDLKLVNNALYMCGSTAGDFGTESQGSVDGFIMKFTLNGEKVWRHPYQFGSEEFDSCNGLEVDVDTKTVYVVGTTKGKVFGHVTPANGTMQYFAASFGEFDDSTGLKLIVGRQRRSHGNFSGDAIGFASGRVIVMTTEWDERRGSTDRTMKTYFNVLDRDTLLLHKLYEVISSDEGSFRGIRMVSVNKTGDMFAIGKTVMANNSQLYHAVGVKSAGKEGKGGVAWVTRVGKLSQKANMMHQSPSLIVDIDRETVYVAGVEDGFFMDVTTSEVSGVVLVPFLQLDAKSGYVNETWHRSTTVPDEKEELTDIALDPGKQVVYTGVWNGGDTFHSNALIGSFGSKGYSSRRPGSFPVTTGTFVQAGGEDSEEDKRERSGGKIVGFALLGLGIAGVVLTALIAHRLRSSKRVVTVADESSTESVDMEEIRRKVVDAHRKSGFNEDEEEEMVVIGGSGEPR